MVSPVSAVTDVSAVVSLHLQIGEKGTGTPVPQVTVYLDGNPEGTTDDTGSITISRVIVKTHTLEFVKSGYQDYTMSFTPSCNPGSCPSPEGHNFNVMVSSLTNQGQMSTTPVSVATQTISHYSTVQNGVTPQAYKTQSASPNQNFQNGVTPQPYKTQAVNPGSGSPAGGATQETSSGSLVFTPVIAIVLIVGIMAVSRCRKSR